MKISSLLFILILPSIGFCQTDSIGNYKHKLSLPLNTLINEILKFQSNSNTSTELVIQYEYQRQNMTHLFLANGSYLQVKPDLNANNNTSTLNYDYNILYSPQFKLTKGKADVFSVYIGPCIGGGYELVKSKNISVVDFGEKDSTVTEFNQQQYKFNFGGFLQMNFHLTPNLELGTQITSLFTFQSQKESNITRFYSSFGQNSIESSNFSETLLSFHQEVPMKVFVRFSF